MPVSRTADPYRELDVIDARAPRSIQLTVGVGAVVAALTGWWPILAVLAAQLAIGLRFGRRYCLPCVAYFELVQPRLGEGPIEDSRPPRFANQVGLGVLSAASVAHLVGLHAIGLALSLLVASLALLAATTGLCVGCSVYRIVARMRGIRGTAIERVDLLDIGAVGAPVVVQFTHPLCSDCHELEAQLRAEGRDVRTIDVAARPELARKYGIGLVPAAFAIDADGAVASRLA